MPVQCSCSMCASLQVLQPGVSAGQGATLFPAARCRADLCAAARHAADPSTHPSTGECFGLGVAGSVSLVVKVHVHRPTAVPRALLLVCARDWETSATLFTSLLSMVTAIQSSLHGYCSPVLSMVTAHQSSLRGYSPVFSPLLLSSLFCMVAALQSSLHGCCSPVFCPWLITSSLLSVVTLQSSLHSYCFPVFSPLLLSSLRYMVFDLQSSLHGCCSPVFSPWLRSNLLSMVTTLQSSLNGC